MMEAWRRVRVEDVASPVPNALATGPFGSAISAKYFVKEGVPVIRGSNLSEDVGIRLSDEDLVFLAPEKAETFTRSEARRGDLVFTCWGTIGQVGLIDRRARHERYIVSNKQMKLTPDNAKADSLYLYYAFSSPTVKGAIQGQAIGSSVPGFNLGQLRRIELDLPPLAEQRRIAAILGALDDKIELNRKMNRTLEEMAQALFKSWFLDFDGHDPADLVDSPLGPIPVGWKVGTLDRISENVRDTVDPAEVVGDTPYVALEHVPRRTLALESWGRASDATSPKARFLPGDTLFGKLRPYFHKVVPSPISGVASTDILIVRPMSDEWRWFTFFHLFSDAMVAHATAASDGTKMPRTRWSDLCRFPIALPPAGLTAKFNAIATPLIQRVWNNVTESRTLAELRDTLLPKLISGEIRVPDTDALTPGRP